MVEEYGKSVETVLGVPGSAFGETAMLADSGFDFLLFDTQHSAVESKQLIPALQAMRGKKAAPIIRVSSNRAELICFALEKLTTQWYCTTIDAYEEITNPDVNVVYKEVRNGRENS